MPSIGEQLEAEWKRGEHAVAGWFRHGHPEPPSLAAQTAAARAQTRAPAPQPVNLTAAPAAQPQEDPMQISNIANDIKGAIENADEWVKQVTETHLPAILATAAKYENSPIVQALEAVALPPAVEQEIATGISKLAALFPAPPADAQTAAPGQPAAPVAAAPAQ